MSKILRRGDIDSDDEYDDTVETPQTLPPAPPNTPVEVVNSTVEFKPIKKGKPMPKTHTCEHCGEQFSRNASLVRHIEDMRCTVSRRASIDRVNELDMRERKLRDLENEISNKILKSQEKVKKERKPRVAKPKAIKAEPVKEPYIPVTQIQQPQPRKRPIVNF